MNVLNAIGNINNPELRFMKDETPVLQFSFALNSGYGDKKVTTWLNCSIFGKRAQTLSEMLHKGDRVGISGELTNRKYTDKAGIEKYSLECRINDLTLLGGKDNAKDNSQYQPKQNNSSQNQSESLDDMESDLPF
jgi:single-strand DNA-binding protein